MGWYKGFIMFKNWPEKLIALKCCMIIDFDLSINVNAQIQFLYDSILH